ncbi:hypothetical protein [Halobacillus litoralis]|uniref:hypothetical protein n=1 Tax=Halobacillus litoralis TaxID=45668 RepID=UPI001CD545C4|nr:hypothetical protein [Halobacillus litoralis]MCA1023532.1 hypothetical protein [Halobacillus litoralis]
MVQVADLYSFQHFKKQRETSGKTADKRLPAAVYRSVLYYIRLDAAELQQPAFEYLSTQCSLREIYRNNQLLFLRTFQTLLTHWKLISGTPTLPEYPFTVFGTVGDLCAYIEKRVKAL